MIIPDVKQTACYVLYVQQYLKFMKFRFVFQVKDLENYEQSLRFSIFEARTKTVVRNTLLNEMVSTVQL